MSDWRLVRAPKPGDLVVATPGGYVTDSTVWPGLSKDLETLGLRHRRFHNMRRAFISLLIGDGAPKDVVVWLTHSGKTGNVVDEYTSLSWPAKRPARAACGRDLRTHPPPDLVCHVNRRRQNSAGSRHPLRRGLRRPCALKLLRPRNRHRAVERHASVDVAQLARRQQQRRAVVDVHAAVLREHGGEHEGDHARTNAMQHHQTRHTLPAPSRMCGTR